MRRRRQGSGCPTPRSGVTFIEVLMVLIMVAVLTGVGSMYYRGLIQQGNEERCRIDMRTFKKAIAKLENDERVTIRPDGPHPHMEPDGLGVNESPDPAQPQGFHLEKLLDYRLITRLPRDPWQGEYKIDIPGGMLYSMGPDGMDLTGDEIQIPFRPLFEPLRAYVSEGREAVIVEFSRKLDPYSLYASVPGMIPFQLEINGNGPPAAAPAAQITTAARVMTNPYAAIIRLDKPMAQPAGPGIRVHIVPTAETEVESMDTALLGNPDFENVDEY